MRFFQKWLSLILLFIPLFCLSQEDEDEYYYPENSLEDYKDSELNPGKDLNQSDWLNKMEGVDYLEERKEVDPPDYDQNDPIVEEEEEEEESGSSFAGWWSGLNLLIKGFCILILIALVGYIIYLLTRLESNQSFEVEKSFEERLRNVEEELEESELERLLRESIEYKNYKLAVRLYFLMMLNKLSEKNWIQYKKQKTNFLYLREMKGRTEYQKFRELTYTFEYSWYGEVELDESIFFRLQSNYKTFLSQLES